MTRLPTLLLCVTTFIIYLEPVQSGYLEKVCMLPTDHGSTCDSSPSSLQYAFSAKEEQCVSFTYKGCGGNKNRFADQGDCVDSCQTAWFLKKNENDDSQEEDHVESPDCKAKADGGPCKALVTQWYYDTKSGKCATFAYGGCNGNGNRFNSEKQCVAACS